MPKLAKVWAKHTKNIKSLPNQIESIEEAKGGDRRVSGNILDVYFKITGGDPHILLQPLHGKYAKTAFRYNITDAKAGTDIYHFIRARKNPRLGAGLDGTPEPKITDGTGYDAVTHVDSNMNQRDLMSQLKQDLGKVKATKKTKEILSTALQSLNAGVTVTIDKRKKTSPEEKPADTAQTGEPATSPDKVQGQTTAPEQGQPQGDDVNPNADADGYKAAGEQGGQSKAADPQADYKTKEDDAKLDALYSKLAQQFNNLTPSDTNIKPEEVPTKLTPALNAFADAAAKPPTYRDQAIKRLFRDYPELETMYNIDKTSNNPSDRRKLNQLLNTYVQQQDNKPLTKTIEYPGFMGKLNRLKDLLGTQKQDASVRATEYDPEYGETKFKSDAELSKIYSTGKAKAQVKPPK